MTEVKKMYKVVRYIDSNENHIPRTRPKTVEEALSECGALYAKKRPWCNARRATDWLENAYKHKFIRAWGNEEEGYGFKVEHSRGQQLLATKFPLRRVGLRKMTLKEYPETKAMFKAKFVAFVSALATIIAAVVGTIVSIIRK